MVLRCQRTLDCNSGYHDRTPQDRTFPPRPGRVPGHNEEVTNVHDSGTITPLTTGDLWSSRVQSCPREPRSSRPQHRTKTGQNPNSRIREVSERDREEEVETFLHPQWRKYQSTSLTLVWNIRIHLFHDYPFYWTKKYKHKTKDYRVNTRSWH